MAMPRKIAALPGIAPINRWVVDAMNFAGMSGAALANELHKRKVINTNDRSVPSKIARGERQVDYHEAVVIADITNYRLPIPGPDLPEAALAGAVGAGGHIIDVQDDTGEYIPHIAVLSGTPSAAVEISGDSMGVLFEGWYAIIDRPEREIHKGLHNRLCVIKARDGRALIKVLDVVSDKHVRLISGNGEIDTDQADIEWVAKVVGLRPKT